MTVKSKDVLECQGMVEICLELNRGIATPFTVRITTTETPSNNMSNSSATSKLFD